MQKKLLRTSLFGFSKTEVFDYIARVNDEFNGKWDELAYRSEKLIAQLQYKPIEDIINT